MKKLFAIALATVLSIATQFAYAQDDVDALRFSTLQYGSTARSLAVGGAFGALGADFSTLSTNPAGIGVYRSSEFIFSAEAGQNYTAADFLGSSRTEEDYYFKIPNVGWVWTQGNQKRGRTTGGPTTHTFGLGMNSLANYNSDVVYEGYNENNSILDTYLEFLNNGNGVSPDEVSDIDPFGASLAYETFLINPSTTDSNFYNAAIADGDVMQSKRIQTSGRHSEMVVSYGANFGDKFYLGATVGVPFIRYKSTITYEETDTEEVHDDFGVLGYEENERTRGVGINAKVGFIVRANDFLRLGGAVHTPTAFAMRDRYDTYMSSYFDNSDSYEAFSPIGEFDYGMKTPWRAIASAALVSPKLGFLSVDYEWVDYSSASYDFGAFNEVEDNVNDLISNKYQAVGNLRLGGELKMDKVRFRGGYALMGSPFAEGRAAGSADFSRTTYSGGIGLKEEAFFLDLTYAHSISQKYDLQYNLADESEPIEGADLDETLSSFVLSFGLRF